MGVDPRGYFEPRRGMKSLKCEQQEHRTQGSDGKATGIKLTETKMYVSELQVNEGMQANK